MKESIGLCRAAGIDVDKMEPMAIFLTSGKLLSDEVLREKALKYRQGSVLHEDAYHVAVKAMTPAERVALRERVAGVVAFPGKS